MAIRKSILFHEDDEKEMYVYQILQEKKRGVIDYLVDAILFYEYSQFKAKEAELKKFIPIDQEQNGVSNSESMDAAIVLQEKKSDQKKGSTETRKGETDILEEMNVKTISSNTEDHVDSEVYSEQNDEVMDPDLFANVSSFLSSF